MSVGDTTGYCTIEDVQDALQQADANMDGPLADAPVEAAIKGASRWFHERSGAHFYDSNTTNTLLPTSAASVSNIQLSVASSPHRQNGQLFHAAERAQTHVNYPVTHAGRYTRVRLPKRDVDTIDRLGVREPGGELEDWVAGDQTEGRGEDYYAVEDGGDSFGRYYLYLDVGAIGARFDFDNLLEVDLTYGRDWQDNPWTSVRRGIAAVAGAQLITDDDIIAQVPDEGQLIGVDTQADHLLYQAFGYPDGDSAGGYLSGYLKTPVA